MKFKTLSLSLILFLSLNVSAKEILNVDALILKAMDNSPDLKISTSKYQAAKEKLNIADSDYLPKVDLVVSGGQFGQTDIQNDDPSKRDNMIDSTGIKGTLFAKQLLYDFGKTGDNIDFYLYDSQAKQMKNQQDISNKIKEVKLAYYEVLQAIALIEVNKENVKLNDAQLYRSKKYFRAGIRTKIDVSDAKVQLIKAKLDLKKSEYALKTTYANLDKVIGFTDVETDYAVYTRELNLDTLYSTIKEYNLNLYESIEYAYANRFEIKQYLAQKKAATAQKEKSTSEFYPSVYLSGEYTKLNVKDDSLQDNIPKDKWSATVDLEWNLYEGGSTSAAEQEKKIQLSISNSELLEAKLAIKKETTEAFINVNQTKDSVELSQSLLEVSNEKFYQASKRYKHGLSDYIELQQARQDYIDAKASLVIEYYNYYAAVSSLDNAIGK